MKVLLALALAHGVTLHAGQVRFYEAGQLHPGAKVICIGTSERTTATVPRVAALAGTVAWDFGSGGGPTISVQLRPGGAVAAACGVDIPMRRPDLPYVLGRNGLGLLDGTSTLAGVRRLFGGSATASRGSCRLTSSSLGFVADFAGGCSATARLVSATVTGGRWSTLDGVRIGDSVARMRWQDWPARLWSPGIWLLGGEGRRQPPRLLAVVRDGRVAVFEFRTR